jgi:hypothetical protein
VDAGHGERPACDNTFTIERICMRTSRRRAEILVRALGMNGPSEPIPAKTGRQCNQKSPEQTENPRTVRNVTAMHDGLDRGRAAHVQQSTGHL